MSLYIFEETTSTNDLAKSHEYIHGDVIWALHQSAGRGQRGNRWSGGVGENIAISIVLEPRELAAGQQFVIAQIAALALYDTLAHYLIECRVKWTNDIYIGDKKIAGVLIENSLCEGLVTRSIIGIGLNINQLEFDPELPNPISMAVVVNSLFNREEVLETLHERFMARYEQWVSGGREAISEEYNQYLYRLNEQHTFRLPSGEHFLATIQGVSQRGELQLLHDDGAVKSYHFKEVEYII